MLHATQYSNSSSTINKPIIDKIYKIHSIRDQVSDKVRIKKKLLIPFGTIDCQRQNTQQQKQAIGINQCCSIKSESMKRQLQKRTHVFDHYKIHIVAIKEYTCYEIKNIGQKNTISQYFILF